MALLRKDNSGSTLYEHCAAIEQQVGVWPEDYPRPEIPELGADIWDWFWQLRAAAAYGASGPSPLAYTEIEAWSRLFQTVLTPMEVRLIMALDQQYLDDWYAEQARNKPKGTR